MNKVRVPACGAASFPERRAAADRQHVTDAAALSERLGRTEAADDVVTPAALLVDLVQRQARLEAHR
jgi:hypothetical protein